MAFNIKYRLSFTDTENVSKRLDILPKDYVGAIIAVEGSDDPVKVRMEGNGDDPLAPLKPTSVIISLYSEIAGQYDEFHDITDLQYMVRYYVAGQLHFQGFIAAQQFSEPYDNGLYFVSLTAIDGIGFLKNRQYVTGGRKTHLAIINECLAYTGSSLNVLIGVSLKESRMSASLSAMSQCYVDTDTFRKNERDNWFCIDVLKDILVTYTARIQMQNGKWVISSIDDLYDGSVLAYEYSPTNQFLGSSSLGNIKYISEAVNSSNICLLEGGTISKLPALREGWIKQDFGKSDRAIIKNGDFSKWEPWEDDFPEANFSEKPVGWSVLGHLSVQRSRSTDYSALVIGQNFDESRYLYYETQVIADNTKDYIFEFECAVLGVESNINFADVWIELYFVNGSTTYWPEPGKTTYINTRQFIKVENVKILPVELKKFYKFSITLNSCPGGTLKLKLYQPKPHAGVTSYHLTGTYFDNIKFYPTEVSVEYGIAYLHGINNGDYNLVYPKIETIQSDIPAIINSTLLYKNYLSLDATGNIPTESWTGINGNFTINNHRLRSLLNIFSKSIRRKSFLVIGSVLPTTVLIDHQGIRYLIVSIDTTERDHMVSIEAVELVAPGTDVPVITEEQYASDPESNSTSASNYRSENVKPAELSALTVTPELLTINRDLHVKGRITAEKNIIAHFASAYAPEIFANLLTEYPIYKPNSSKIGLKYNAAQMEVNELNELQIKPEVLTPDEHTQAMSTITGLTDALAAKAGLNSPALTGTPTAPNPSTSSNSSVIATTAFVKAVIAALVDSSPASLDTLNELAAALGDDPNFATTVLNALAAKAPLNSPAFTGMVSGITKAMVGLGSADDTSDAAKPVSQAQQAALNQKLDAGAKAADSDKLDGYHNGQVTAGNIGYNSAAGQTGVTFLQLSGQNAAGDNPTGQWCSVMKLNHGDGDIYYNRTLAFDFFTDEIYTRRRLGGDASFFVRLWSSGNSNKADVDWNAKNMNAKTYEIKDAAGTTIWTIQPSATGNGLTFVNADGVKTMKLEQSGRLLNRLNIVAHSTEID